MISCLLALLPGTALAVCPDPTPVVDRALADVLAADFDQADVALQAATEGFDCGAPASKEGLARLWLVEGAVLWFRGDQDDAVAEFASARAAAPSVWVEELGHKLQAVAALAVPHGTAPVALAALPAGTDTWVDGAPLSLPAYLPAGPHLVQLVRRSTGQVVAGRFVHLYPGEAQTLDFPDLSTAEPAPAPAPAPAPRPTPAATPALMVAACALFDAGGTFMTQPPDNKDSAPGLPYNGFAGFSPGFGVGAVALYRGFLGLEIDLDRRHDLGRSEFTLVTGERYDWSISQWAWHLPVLARLELPSGIGRPFLALGPEWVFPSDADVDAPKWTLPTSIDAHAGTWLVWTAGIGIDFVIPVGRTEIRVPFTVLRGGYHPVPLSAYERAYYTIVDGRLVSIDYVSEWQIQADIAVGPFVRVVATR